MDIPYQFSKELEPGMPSRCPMLWAATKPTNQPTLFPKHPFSPYKGILLAAGISPSLEPPSGQNAGNDVIRQRANLWRLCQFLGHASQKRLGLLLHLPEMFRNAPERFYFNTHFWSLYCFYLLKPYLRGKWRQMTCFSMSMVRKWFFKKYAAQS